MAGTIWAIMQEKEKYPENFEILEDDMTTMPMEYLLIAYCLQHVLFTVTRIVAWIVWCPLTCCCSRGKEYDKSDDFKWHFISVDYVKYQLEQLDNMNNFQAGREEMEFTRNLEECRQSINIKKEEVDTTKVFDKMRYQVRKRVIDTLALSN